MRLILPTAWNAARYQLNQAAGGGGPWADPFDDPTGTVFWSRWIDDSTSGTAKDNSALWSNKLGFPAHPAPANGGRTRAPDAPMSNCCIG